MRSSWRSAAACVRTRRRAATFSTDTGRTRCAPPGRGQVLIPWPNRLEDGSYEFEGERHQLPLDEPESGNAIHGLVRWAGWTVAEREPHRVVMEHVLHPRPGYPFSLALAIEYRLSEEGLVGADHGDERRLAGVPVRERRSSISDGRDADGGLGRPPRAARTVLQANERGIPVGEIGVEGTDYDFRRPRPIGATRLDHCFTDLERDGDGIARVTLQGPDGARASHCGWTRRYPYVMLFTGDPLPDVARRSLAVEPMTCPPNAFRTGTDLIRLAPGESVSCAWGIHPSK